MKKPHPPTAKLPLERTLTPARLAYTELGQLFSHAYDDVYHAAAGGLAQAQQVFIAGNGLPERWRGRQRFVIIETGFGLGLNFLATWAAWRADPQRCPQLHFISSEKHPFSASDLATLHSDFPELSELAAELRRQWPQLLPGNHRLHFDEPQGGQLTLTLLFGDAGHTLPSLLARADAFYLDGFSPAKNPEMWSPYLCKALANHAAPGATLATWTVAGEVRRGLSAAGFKVEKSSGFANKRQMLRGHIHYARPLADAGQVRQALVIGAGFAGTSVAERLAARGWQVTLIDAVGPAAGASGNRIGIFQPLLSADDNSHSRLIRSAFFYALRHWQTLTAAGLPIRWSACGVLQLARDAEHEALQRRTAEMLQAPPDYLRYVDRQQASQLAGQALPCGGWWFAGAGWAEPPSLCAANLQRFPARITPIFGQSVARIAEVNGIWQALTADDSLLAAAPTLILANAADAKRLAGSDWLPLRPARGQATLLPQAATPPLSMVLCRQGYVTPAVDGRSVCGASFIVDDEACALRVSEHQDNLAKLEAILPGQINYAALPSDLAQLPGRVGFRPVSLDRLPLLGQLPAGDQPIITHLRRAPRRPGLWLASGFGARGLVWSALAGELLASQINGDPLPLPNELVNAVDPARFLTPGRHKLRPLSDEE